MPFCLPKFATDALKEKLISRSITPEGLADLSSEARRQVFTDIVGEANAKEVNALFESKLILKNQQAGMISWAKQVLGLKHAALRDTLSKVERMQNILQPMELSSYLNDLVEKKLGINVSVQDAGKLVNLAKLVEDAKSKITPDMPDGSPEILDYGSALVTFKNFVEELKTKTNPKDLQYYKEHPTEAVIELANATKSAKASLDVSFLGRQGWRVLLDSPDVWVKDLSKKLGDINNSIKHGNAVDTVKADVWSRRLARNNAYQDGRLAISIAREEAIPTNILEKIPVLGKAFRASNEAYATSGIRMRADLFDKYYKQMEENGIDMTSLEQRKSLGYFVNSMTGRGSLGAAEAALSKINALFFSPRFLKSLVDTFTMPLNKGLTPQVRLIAAKSLAKMVGETSLVLLTANLLWPGSVELDPRSSDFGTIRFGNTRFDITGGHKGLLTLAARLVPSYHNGQFSLGGWFKSSKTHKYVKLGTGQFGTQTGVDMLENFVEGKVSPAIGTLFYIWNGKDFNNKPVTPGGVLKQIAEPLPITTYQELKDNPDSANNLLSMILSELGIGVNTY